MPVKMHGLRPVPAPEGEVAETPEPAPAKPFRAPITVGRVIYFLIVMGGLSYGGYHLFNYVMYVSATGVVQRDLDRLAARERGRITRVLVHAGDTVKRGQPLVMLDFVGAGDAEGGFISEAAQRAQQQRSTLEGLEERLHQVSERRAILKGQLAGYRATAASLEPARVSLTAEQARAEKLQQSGAATTAEGMQISVKLAEVEEQQASARGTAHEAERGLAALAHEESQLRQAIADLEKLPAPTGDPGVITASRDGVVAWVAHRAGEVVVPEDPIVYLTDSSDVHVRAYVSPKDAGNLVPGRAAQIILPSGEKLHGEIQRIYLLSSLVPDQNQSTQLGRPTQATLTSSPMSPVDPAGAFLLADLTVLDPSPAAAWLAVGAPVEVRVPRMRSWPWAGPDQQPAPAKPASRAVAGAEQKGADISGR